MGNPAIFGEAKFGLCRFGVKGPIYLEDIIHQLENQPVSSGSGGSGELKTVLVWGEGKWGEHIWG